MHYIDDFKGSTKKGLTAALDLVRRFAVGNLDVVQIDIENTGASALTNLRLYGRSAPSAPMRDITPASWTSESALLFSPAAASPASLAAGASAQFGLNVTAMYEIEIHAAGAGAVLSIAGGGFKVQS